MNLVTATTIGRHKCAVLLLLALLVGSVGGCVPALSSPDEVAEFLKVGPQEEEDYDVSELELADVPKGAYRVVPGDVLIVQLPDLALKTAGGFADVDRVTLHERRVAPLPLPIPPLPHEIRGPKDSKAVAAFLAAEKTLGEEYGKPLAERDLPGALAEHEAIEAPADATELRENVRDRVRFLTKALGVRKGGISLPVIGPVPAAGRTLVELESIIAEAYSPYVTERPSVLARVSEYHNVYATVVGGVGRPGVYQLRSDELSLTALLEKAGGLTGPGGGIVRIERENAKGTVEALDLPIRNINVPVADVALRGGERVEVEPGMPQRFTVVGLATRPGEYAYPVNTRFNVVEALGVAGGAEQIQDARFVTIYRKNGEGEVVSARFQLNPSSQWNDLNPFADSSIGPGAFVAVKPGDVLSVERTVRTRVRRVLARALGVSITVGASLRGGASWDYSRSKTVRDHKDIGESTEGRGGYFGD